MSEDDIRLTMTVRDDASRPLRRLYAAFGCKHRYAEKTHRFCVTCGQRMPWADDVPAGTGPHVVHYTPPGVQ